MKSCCLLLIVGLAVFFVVGLSAVVNAVAVCAEQGAAAHDCADCAKTSDWHACLLDRTCQADDVCWACRYPNSSAACLKGIADCKKAKVDRALTSVCAACVASSTMDAHACIAALATCAKKFVGDEAVACNACVKRGGDAASCIDHVADCTSSDRVLQRKCLDCVAAGGKGRQCAAGMAACLKSGLGRDASRKCLRCVEDKKGIVAGNECVEKVKE